MQTTHSIFSIRLVLLLGLLLSLSLLQNLHAQAEKSCGTIEEEHQTDSWAFVQRWRHSGIEKTVDTIVDVPIQFHIIGAINGGFAIDSFLVFRELQIINSFYTEAGIRFVHCGAINYIYDNRYIVFVKGDDELLCDEHDRPGVINIYFAPNLENRDGDGLCGYAYNLTNKNRLIMDNGCSSNGTTLGHELGHTFSLRHTHSTYHGHELADGSNCTTAGDQLCDTPADPRLSNDVVDRDCVYTGTELDDNQMAYMPDTRNIMSYSRKHCREHFSEEQLAQMAAFHQLHVDLLFCNPDDVTAAHEPDPTLRIRIGPNPTRATLWVQYVPADSHLYLSTIDGKLLWQQTIGSEQSQLAVSIFEQLPANVYLLTLHHQQYTTTQKVVKL